MNSRTARAALAAAIAVLALVVSPAGAEVPKPVIVKAKGGKCVEPPAAMRRDHPDLLKHQRDLTVHRGIRGARVDLEGCVECHANPRTGSVASAPDDFCESCHRYAAVKIDCFECHATRPKAALRAGAGK